MHFVQTQCLDRCGQNNAATVDLEALSDQAIGNVMCLDRSVKLQIVTCLTDQDDVCTLDAFTGFFRVAAAIGVACFTLCTFGLELRDIILAGPQSLALWNQKIAGMTRAHGDNVTHLAQFLDALQKNDVHLILHRGIGIDTKSFTKVSPVFDKSDGGKHHGAKRLEDEYHKVATRQNKRLRVHAARERMQNRETL